MMVSSKNQITCSAGRLSQLRPDMVEAITQGSAFGIGQQYFTERRVRILRADDREIASEVAGAGGLYVQTIALTGGYLVTKCSCPSQERPLCRHCVAVLLEYNRLNPDYQPAAPGYSQEPDLSKAADDLSVEMPMPEGNGAGMQLREIAMLMDWLPLAVQAVNDGRSLPEAPTGLSGNALLWVRALQRLDERAARSEKDAAALRVDLRVKQEHLAGAARDLQGLKLELENCHATLNVLHERERERDRMADAIQGMTSEVMKKAAEVDRQVAEWRSHRPT